MVTDLSLHQRRRSPTQMELNGIPWLSSLDAQQRERTIDELDVTDALPGDYVCRMGRPVTFWCGVGEGLLKTSNDKAPGQN